MSTATAGTTTTIKGVYYQRTAKRPNRLAVAALWYLETVCELTGHAGACILLNSFRVGRFGTWWHRHVIVRLHESADTFTRWERLP